MKFATKLSLGCIALLSCALGAAGLLLTGQSFSGSLASTRTALQAQQEKDQNLLPDNTFRNLIYLYYFFLLFVHTQIPSKTAAGSHG